MGWARVCVGPVFAVVTHGTGLVLAGPFLLWCWSRTTIKSIRSKLSGLLSLPVGGAGGGLSHDGASHVSA